MLVLIDKWRYKQFKKKKNLGLTFDFTVAISIIRQEPNIVLVNILPTSVPYGKMHIFPPGPI